MTAKPVVLNKSLSRLLVQYYLGPDHPMKLRIWRWLRWALRHARITIPYLDDKWITVDERDYLQNQILRYGQYEPEIWDSLSNFIVADEIIWDIGANIGSFTIQALTSKYVEHIYAFEPDPIHRSVLEANVRLNLANDRCTINPCALSDHRHFSIFYRGSFPHTGGSNLTKDLGNGQFVVECCTADDLIYSQNVKPPTLIKMDVESWEEYVVKGAHKLLRENPPKAIVFEADSDKSGTITNSSLVQFFYDYGYSITWLQRYDNTIYHRENYLAVYNGD